MIIQIVIGVFIVLLLFMLYKHFYGIPSNGKGFFGIDLIGGIRGLRNFEGFKLNPAGLDHTIGKYGGLSNLENELEQCLKNKKKCEKLAPNQECDNDMCTFEIAPNVDGTPSSGRSLGIFKFNKSSPECCPSPYSTSTGCVCLTNEQRNMISGRKGNGGC